MKVAMELGVSRSSSFYFVLETLSKVQGFNDITALGGTKRWRIELTEKDFPLFDAIWLKVWGWKATAFYIDDRLVGSLRAWEMMRTAYWALEPWERVRAARQSANGEVLKGLLENGGVETRPGS